MVQLKSLILRAIYPLDSLLASLLLRLRGDQPGVVALLFHALADSVEEPGFRPDLHLTFSQFDTAIRHFREAGYTFLHLADLLKPLDPQGRFVWITFDDGNTSDLRALEILEAHDVPATFFVTTGHLRPDTYEGRSDFLSPLSRQELTVLSAHPLASIGNHSHWHRPFPSLTQESLAEDLNHSQAELGKTIGYRPKALAFPYGSWSPEVIQVCRESGFQLLVSASPKQNPIPLNKRGHTLWVDRFRLQAHQSVDSQCRVLRAGRILATTLGQVFNRAMGVQQ
jgi:peptidoglycan/xylan/chitin deacetylase (PgdA/CDA1 family)